MKYIVCLLFIAVSMSVVNAQQSAKQSATFIHNPNEEIILPTYKDGEVGLAKPSIETLQNVQQYIKGRWKYVKTEYENKQKYFVTETRSHKSHTFKMPETNHDHNHDPSQTPPAPMAEPANPGSAPEDPNKAYFENLNTAEKDLDKIVEMLDTKFEYYFMYKNDTSGNYRVMELTKEGMMIEHTVWDIRYNIYTNKTVPMLSFVNLQKPGTTMNFNIFRLNENEMVLADLKRKIVHYFNRAK